MVAPASDSAPAFFSSLPSNTCYEPVTRIRLTSGYVWMSAWPNGPVSNVPLIPAAAVRPAVYRCARTGILRGVTMTLMTRAAFVALALFCPLSSQLQAQTLTAPTPPARSVIVPQTRVVAPSTPDAVIMTDVKARVEISEQVATTTLEVGLQNPSARAAEAELVVPVPPHAVVRDFTFQGSAPETSARLLTREEARRTYDAIVSRAQDPALLEFVGYNMIRSSVFPVTANGTQRVRLVYEELLERDGDRIDYVLPRTESLDYHVPWEISATVRSKTPIATVYSPSHPVATQTSANSVSLSVTQRGGRIDPGSLRISYLAEHGDMSASLVAYPDANTDGGYFLLLGGVPSRAAGDDDENAHLKREVTLVIDRSGSMKNGKFEQAREAALQVIAGLNDGEMFHLLVYNDAVDRFSDGAAIKSAATLAAAAKYLRGVTPVGGTNLHDALLEALIAPKHDGTLPIVLFLTDGLPTVGQTSEAAIRELISKRNDQERRVFTFGVGFDVNTPLLENLAYASRGRATFVLPSEDVEVKVGSVFRKLSGPVLASPILVAVDDSGNATPHRVRDLLPAALPDLYEGDQLNVIAKYIGTEPITFVLSGNYRGQERSFRFAFNLDRATTRNAYVPRLWASRKIGMLEDEIRNLGADPTASSGVATDPRFKELVDAIVDLSTEFGILSEYTAFLALEGSDLSDREAVASNAGSNFIRRAVRVRTGIGGCNQDVNRLALKTQICLNISNNRLDENLNQVEVAAVQQVSDRAFYRRGARWIDSRLVNRKIAEPDREVEFGSSEFKTLLERLTRDGRQGCVSLRGDILMTVDGETVLVRGPVAPASSRGRGAQLADNAAAQNSRTTTDSSPTAQRVAGDRTNRSAATQTDTASDENQP